jgi:hypothetical protein
MAGWSSSQGIDLYLCSPCTIAGLHGKAAGWMEGERDGGMGHLAKDL